MHYLNFKALKKYLFVLFIFSSFIVKAQDPNEKGNLVHYYNQPLHFGFALGINRANFMIDPSEHFEVFDSLKKVQSKAKMGFNLGMISEARLHKYLTLRLVPNLAFSERTLLYTFEGVDTVIRTKNIESTFINIPLDFKLRSKRVHNFAAYLIGGASYAIDLASKKNVPPSTNPNLNEQTVKLYKTDVYYEVGTGVDFFLEYFKFGIEAKISVGTGNMIKKENTIFSNSINRLNSKVFMLSFTFEG